MGTTPNYAWPYPELGNQPNGPAQLAALGTAADATVRGVDVRLALVEGRFLPIYQAPRARLRQTTVQALATNAYTSVAFQTEDFDVGNGHDNTTNNTRYTATVAGVYQLSGAVSYAANATGQRALHWRKNGANQLDGSQVSMATIGGGALVSLAARTLLVVLAVGDYVELQAYQDTGSPLNTFAGSAGTSDAQSSLDVWWVGP